MKLTNHNDNNSYDIDTYVMRGTITMTPKEWNDAYLYLWNCYQRGITNVETYQRDSLSSLKKDKGLLFSIGVLATSLLVKKYHLKGYKDQNYGIKLI